MVRGLLAWRVCVGLALSGLGAALGYDVTVDRDASTGPARAEVHFVPVVGPTADGRGRLLGVAGVL